MVTPAHIVPEWYFLPFYAILRSISDKLKGVVFMMLAIVIFIPFSMYLNNQLYTNFVASSGLFRPYYQKVFKIFLSTCLILGWIGGNSAVTPYVQLGGFFSFIYFSLIIVGFTLTNILEFIFYGSVYYFLERKVESEYNYYKGRDFWESFSNSVLLKYTWREMAELEVQYY